MFKRMSTTARPLWRTVWLTRSRSPAAALRSIFFFFSFFFFPHRRRRDPLQGAAAPGWKHPFDQGDQLAVPPRDLDQDADAVLSVDVLWWQLRPRAKRICHPTGTCVLVFLDFYADFQGLFFDSFCNASNLVELGDGSSRPIWDPDVPPSLPPF